MAQEFEDSLVREVAAVTKSPEKEVRNVLAHLGLPNVVRAVPDASVAARTVSPRSAMISVRIGKSVIA